MFYYNTFQPLFKFIPRYRRKRKDRIISMPFYIIHSLSFRIQKQTGRVRTHSFTPLPSAPRDTLKKDAAHERGYHGGAAAPSNAWTPRVLSSIFFSEKCLFFKKNGLYFRVAMIK